MAVLLLWRCAQCLALVRRAGISPRLNICTQGAAFVIVLHSWKGFLQPLVIQAAMTVISLADEPLFRIYILGEPATGKLQRPFKKDMGARSRTTLVLLRTLLCRVCIVDAVLNWSPLHYSLCRCALTWWCREVTWKRPPVTRAALTCIGLAM